jgi:hypothetical protein
MNNLYFRALRSSIFGSIVMAALLFVPAGTLDYWQAFVFMAVFVGASAPSRCISRYRIRSFWSDA